MRMPRSAVFLACAAAIIAAPPALAGLGPAPGAARSLTAAADMAAMLTPVACWARNAQGRRHRVRCHAAPPPAYVPAPRYGAPDIQDRPPWAGPNECWTNDGYSRWRPCNAGEGGIR